MTAVAGASSARASAPALPADSWPQPRPGPRLPRLQEYLDLHLAAATKVAASAAAAGDTDESDEEIARPSTASAAAAAAAAASLSAGRRAAGRAGATLNAALPGANGGGPAAGGYQAGDAKKRRKQLLSEIRSAVPRPAATLLADALLAASASEGSSQLGGRDGGNATAAPDAVTERALAATLGHLTALFPQLPPLLLLGAVRRLVAAAAERADGSTSDPAVLSAHLRWVQRLLPSQAQQQQQKQWQGGSDSMLGAAKGRAPAVQLLQQLLAELLPAQAAAAQRAAWQALAHGGGGSCINDASADGDKNTRVSGSGKGSAGGSADTVSSVVDVLSRAVALLLAAVGQSPAGKAAASLASLVPAPTAAAQEAQPATQLETAARSQGLLLARLEQQQQPGLGRQHGSVAPPPRKRWRRADGWRPCALGMLPCTADPNGRLPPQDTPTLLDLPAPFVELQAAEAAAAASAAAAATAAGGKAGQPGEVQQSAAAALLRELQEEQQDTGPWPAADRFTVVAAEAQAGSEEPDTAIEATQRMQLPHQVALLV